MFTHVPPFLVVNITETGTAKVNCPWRVILVKNILVTRGLALASPLSGLGL